MGQFVLVTGPESSGTKLIARLLVENGYIGSYDHHQTLVQMFKKKSKLSSECDYVYRQSVPHGSRLPNYYEIINWALDCNLHHKTIITFRNVTPCLQSKVNRGHNKTLPDNDLLMGQYEHIASNLPMLRPFIFVSTSFLTFAPERTLKEISGFLQTGLKAVDFIYDMDEKHYQLNKTEKDNDKEKNISSVS